MAAPMPRVPPVTKATRRRELVAAARRNVVVLGDVQDRGCGRHGRLPLDERLRPLAGTSWQIPIAESNGVQSPFVRLPIYYGWVVVAVVFVTMGVGVNARTAFSLLFPPILAEFGWERGVTAGAFSFGFLVSAALSPSLGRLMDRRGPRVVIELGVLLIGAGLLLATLVTRPWHLYATLGVMVGGGSVCLGYTGQSLFLPNWFVRRRGLAMSLAFSGVGVGSIDPAALDADPDRALGLARRVLGDGPPRPAAAGPAQPAAAPPPRGHGPRARRRPRRGPRRGGAPVQRGGRGVGGGGLDARPRGAHRPLLVDRHRLLLAASSPGTRCRCTRPST